MPQGREGQQAMHPLGLAEGTTDTSGLYTHGGCDPSIHLLRLGATQRLQDDGKAEWRSQSRPQGRGLPLTWAARTPRPLQTAEAAWTGGEKEGKHGQSTDCPLGINMLKIKE